MSLVGIVDPRMVWCAGIAALVIESGFRVIGRWSAIDEALRKLLDAQADILLLSRLSSRDLRNGEMLALKRRTAIVLIVEPGESVLAGDLPGVGVDALLASDSSVESFFNCLSCVADGHAWLDPAFLQVQTRPRDLPEDWRWLSAREMEVAQLAARGLSNKRIARTLQLSDGTVKIHMHHIFSKLHVMRREELAAELPGTAERLPQPSY